jgi:hypothetical protein
VEGALPDIGFSTALVVDTTGDMVRDLIGSCTQLKPFISGPRGALTRDRRVMSDHAYTVAVSGGTITLKHQQPRKDIDADRWRDRADEHINNFLWMPSEVADNDDDEDESVKTGRVITQWSRKSRARLLKAIADIDHDTWKSTDPWALVTLTLPDHWQAVAPDGQAFKTMVEDFRRRWARTIGKWQCVWKLEFQRRGAPHMHLLMKTPETVTVSRYGQDVTMTFKAWLSAEWADVVDHPDAATRIRHEAAGTNVDHRANDTDPKRVAIYFVKHSSKTQDDKEYQHIVPKEWREPGKGPGRFWGISGLGRHVATVELSASRFYELRRMMRRWHKANRSRTALGRARAVIDQVSQTSVWRRALLEDLSVFGGGRDGLLRSATGGGWVLTNDAPRLLFLMAHWLASTD